MNEFTEVTAANLKAIRKKNGLKQDAIAELLGVEKHSISRIENENRALSESEKSLLDWYFFGILPPRIATTASLQGCLEFTDQEWHVLGRMAARVGQTHAQFITATIRRDITRDKDWPANNHLQTLKVAEDETPNRTNGGKA